MSPIEAPTLAYPVRLADEQIAAVPSASLQAVSESVARIGSIELGQIETAPFLGLPAAEFIASSPNLASQVKTAFEEQEPDADVTVLQLPNPGAGWEQLRVEVQLADRNTDVS